MKKDQVRIGAEIAPNTRLVERRKGERRGVGTLAPLKDGQPLPEGAEIVQLSSSAGEDGWHDVESLYQHGPEPAALGGPAQVATPAYRDGWNRVFGKKEVGVA